jgi:hypothetical protein
MPPEIENHFFWNERLKLTASGVAFSTHHKARLEQVFGRTEKAHR